MSTGTLTKMNDTTEPSSALQSPRYLRAVIGAVVGAFIGYLAFSMLLGVGLYGMVVPGALVGLGCGGLAGGRSWGLAIFAGFLGLMLSLLLEWHFFKPDDSLQHFMANVGALKVRTKLTIAAGTFAAFWFGRGR